MSKRAVFSYFLSLGLHLFLLFFCFLIIQLSSEKPLTMVSAPHQVDGVSVFAPNKAFSEKPKTHFNEEATKNLPIQAPLSESPRAQNAELNEQNSYILLLQRKIQAQSRYPLEARKRNLVGIIEVEFDLTDNGAVEKITTKTPKNKSILEDSAVAAVIASAPFPRPPSGISRHFLIPIEFKIK